MENIISRHMTLREIKAVLADCGLTELPLHWETALWLLFNTYEADEAEVIGFGALAELKFIPRGKEVKQ